MAFPCSGGRCGRCYKPTSLTTGSYFNTAMICMECSKAEEAHPDYEYARKVEEHCASVRGSPGG